LFFSSMWHVLTNPFFSIGFWNCFDNVVFFVSQFIFKTILMTYRKKQHFTVFLSLTKLMLLKSIYKQNITIGYLHINLITTYTIKYTHTHNTTLKTIYVFTIQNKTNEKQTKTSLPLQDFTSKYKSKQRK
jgi:hypothetical protein